jgi:PucR family transcriptional regulator, purine catabolism regulatory protein
VLTVSDVLALPVLRRGLPDIVAGEQHLDRPVRWAHIIDLAEVSGLLKGGEFVLNNGFGIGPDAHTQRAFIRELAEQDVSAVAVELGLVFQNALPAPMTAEATRLDLPLIALHRKTRFVEVTEAIHQRLMGEELTELRRTDELTQQLTEAMLAGSGVPELLGLAARLLGNPLVLEDASQRLVAVAPAQSDEATVVRMWRDVLDAESRDHDSSRGALDTPVRITKGPWGRLVALDLDGSFDDLAPALVERVATSIAVRLVTQQQVEELGARSRGALIDELVAGRLGEQEATRRAAALGFVSDSRALLPLALAWRGGAAAESVSWVALSAELRSALSRVGMNALIGPHADRLLLVVDPRREGETKTLIDDVAGAIRDGAARQQLTADDLAISVGRMAETWADVGLGLDRASRHVAVAVSEAPAPWYDASRVGLSDLLSEMGNSPTLRAFLHDRLGPLAEDVSDRRHAELLRTLEAYLTHGGSKTAAAHSLHLERQSLYHRLDRLTELLGTDWSDGDELLELHVAVRARRLLRDDPSVE